MRQKEIKPVNQSLGKNAQIGIFTGFQFAISMLSFGLGFFLAFPLGVGMIWSILVGIWFAVTAIILSGKRPYLFWSRIFPNVPFWTRGYIKYSSPIEKRKAETKKVGLWH